MTDTDTLTEEKFFQWAQKKGAESAKATGATPPPEPQPGSQNEPPPQPQAESGQPTAEPQNGADKGGFDNYIFSGGSAPRDPEAETQDAAKDAEAFRDPADEKGPSYKSRQTARFASKTFDTLTSALLQQYAEGPSRKPYKADDEEMDELIEAMAMYLETVNGDIPPGVMLLLVVMMIYVPKGVQANRDRKQNRGQQRRPTGPSAASEPEPEPQNEYEDVETEEVGDTEVDFLALVSDFNEKARRLGAEEILADRPVPDGLCKWHFYIKGSQVRADAGAFASSREQSLWGQQCRKWKKLGLDYHFLQDLAVV